MLSVLLTISSLATATFFVSAEGGGGQHDLENQISKCDEIIEECNETILDFEKEKDSNIESINNELQALDEIKKILNTGEILECDLKDLESQNQDLLQKIEYIKKNYQESIKLACETLQQQIDKKAELQKKLDEIEKQEKNSEQNIDDLIKKSEDLVNKFKALSFSNRNKLDRLSRVAIINFPKKCQDICNKLPLNKEQVDMLQAEFNDLKAKVDAICQNEKSPNKFENLQAKSGTSDQNQKNAKLWQIINSGAQEYKPNHIADNLCWLHSATNVRNYYNNMKNKGIVKGQTEVVKEYKQIMGDQAAANKVNGKMQYSDSIAEYLQKCGLGSFQITISSSSKSAEQKVKNTAKELLKAHFNKIQNTSPVIGHTGGSRGHFITIVDYDQDKDQFLIVNSLEDRSIEARVTWRESSEFLQALTKTVFSSDRMIELNFTSDVSKSRSIALTLSDNDLIYQRDATNYDNYEEEIQTSINALKNMIEHY